MIRAPKSYENAKIYRIVSFSTGKQYIGSTCDSLAKRLSSHKAGYKLYQAGKGHYVTSYEILGHGDPEIYLIENVQCRTKDELHKREGEIIETTDCINKRVAGRDKICEHGRERYKCKDCEGAGICEHDKRKVNCITCKGTGICEHNKRRDACKQCDAISTQIVFCECGEQSTKGNLLRHQQTKHHRIMMSI